MPRCSQGVLICILKLKHHWDFIKIKLIKKEMKRKLTQIERTCSDIK